MKHSEKEFIFKQISKKKFLEGVKGRLENDVRSYFDYIEHIFNTKNIGVGFWAAARMIFPVLEAVALAIYKGKNAERKSRLLKELNIDFPNLTWQMFRHPLMHCDQPHQLIYGEKVVNWEMRIGGGHNFGHLHLGVDIKKLYDDFLSFLDKEIFLSEDETVNVKDAVIFNEITSDDIKQEFERLSR